MCKIKTLNNHIVSIDDSEKLNREFVKIIQ